MRYAAKWPVYKAEWDRMVINPSRLREFDAVARYAIDHKAQYLEVEAATGVKWYHVAVIHRREGDGNFGTYLGNGQSLRRVTTIVPRGRGPFSTFLAGAKDALRLDGLTSVSDWRLEKILYYAELFNGAGYDMHGRPSPYVWGGTNIQQPGKYVSDGQWDGSHWDTQPGCAPMLKEIARLDPTVSFVRED